MRNILAFVLVFSTSCVYALEQGKAKKNYERYCAGCHGFNGMSINPDAPNLRMNEGLLQADFQIVEKLKAGSAKKPPMRGLLSDQELQQIVTYIRTIN